MAKRVNHRLIGACLHEVCHDHGRREERERLKAVELGPVRALATPTEAIVRGSARGARLS